MPVTHGILSQYLHRVGQKVKDHALFLCVMDFFHTGRQFLLGTAVNHMYLGTQTKSGSGGVHSHVSAADNDDLFAVDDRCVIVVAEGFHQIVSGQILVGREHAVGLLSRNAHEHGKSRAGADEYGFKAFLLHQLVDGDGFADDHVCLDLYTKGTNIFHFLRHDLVLRKTEFRDTVDQNAACLVQRFEDGHVIAHLRQVAGAGKACRAGTDDSHLMAVLLFGGLRLDAVLSAQSATKRSSFPMETASPLMPRMHLPSHWVSCGQTRPQTAGSALDFADDLIGLLRNFLLYLPG